VSGFASALQKLTNTLKILRNLSGLEPSGLDRANIIVTCVRTAGQIARTMTAGAAGSLCAKFCYLFLA
jgi:hypothetical protein